ncbi:hypothetical protein QQ045_013834 [Rhodiola kirilowii]
MEVDDDNLTEFFKVYISHYSSKQMVSPLLNLDDKKAGRPAFSAKPFFEKSITTSHIGGGSTLSLPNSFVQEHSLRYQSNQKMVLRTSRNSSWEVKIIKFPSKICLCRGWRIFAHENSIRVGDVCKFELLDRLEMMVHVVHCQDGTGQANIGVSMSEPRSVKSTVGVSQPGLRRGSPFISKGQKSAACTRLSSVKPSFVLEMTKYNVDQHFIVSIPAWFVKENTLSYQANEKMILRTKKDSSWPVNITRSKSKTTYYYCFCGGWAAVVHDNNIKEGPLLHSEDKIAGKPAFSVKPFFEKSITISHINNGAYLNLPNSFIQEHSLRYESNEKMVLRTSRNSSWKVNIIKYPGKILLRRGWGIFARENSIRVGDVCKFELLDRLEMMVHVVHCQEGTRQANVGVSTWELRSLKRTDGVSQPGLRRGSPFIPEGRKSAASTMLSSAKPSFVLEMVKHNFAPHYMVSIPLWFIQENSLRYQSNEKMILRTKKDSSWPVNISQTKWKTTYYYRFCGGWAAFVRDNNLKEGDAPGNIEHLASIGCS